MKCFSKDVLTIKDILLYENKMQFELYKTQFVGCSCVIIWLIVYNISGKWCEVGSIVNLY